MKDALKKILGTVAPVLAAGLGGPLAGSVVQVVANALGIKADAPDVEDQIVAKLETATAADWLAIKQAEQTFQIEMRKLDIEELKVGVDEQRIAAEDRDSARKREVATNDTTQRNLAYMIFVAFIGVLAGEFYLLIEAVSIDANALRLLDITLGMLLVLVTAVAQYYFGSSAGSKLKTLLLGN